VRHKAVVLLRKTKYKTIQKYFSSKLQYNKNNRKKIEDQDFFVIFNI